MQLFKKLQDLFSLQSPKVPTEHRMYVIVRQELEETYRAVQGAHSLAQFAIEHSQEFKAWSNQYLIFLEVRFPSGIYEEVKRLTKLGLEYSVFYEPDINQHTSIACYASTDIFQHLPLA